MSKIRRPNDVTDAVADEFFCEHLPYEIDMMRGMYAELKKGPHSVQLLQNSHIESFHIHARNLIEFFKNKTPCDFDPRLFTEPSYQPDGNFISAGLEAKINQQISHLTAQRTGAQEGKLGPDQWTEIGEAIEEQIERFEKALKAKYKPKWKYNKRIYIKQGATSASSQVVLVSTTNTTAIVEGGFVRIKRDSQLRDPGG
jgi:hypothetical protein